MNCHNKPQALIRFLMVFFCIVFTAGQAFGAASAGYSEYFIPGDENLMSFVLDDIAYDDVSGPLHSIISVTAWSPNTTVYYDHWEDGYDFDKADPAATADEIRLIVPRGDSEIFEGTDVPNNPRGTATYYDGRDHIYVAGGAVTVARASWTEAAGTLLAVAWEVYPVRPQLTTYIMPFGEDLARDAAKNYWDFDRVYNLIQATADGTVIQVDLDKDGVYDQLDWDRDGTLDGTTHTLNQGDVLLLDRVTMGDQAINGAAVNGSTADNLLIAGTRIQASATIQVQYVVGDQGSNYEVRGLSAFPRGFWDNEYYAPVNSGTSANNGDTDIYLYNPNDTVLRIDYQTNGGGSGWFNINPKTTRSYFQGTGGYVPLTSGVYLSASDVFWGVSTIDTSDGDAADFGAGRTHDWGYSLVPAFLLENEHFMGWAPGSYPVGTGGDADNSGVYLSPAQDNTRIFIDYNPSDANPFDVFYDLDRLDSQYVFDPNDGDMTEANIYATGPYVAAYGQNPGAPAATPAIDVGYTTIPGSDFIDLVLRVNKSVDPGIIPTASPQQTTFTLEVETGKYPVDDIEVIDLLPPDWEYVGGTTQITLPDGSSPGITDPTPSGPDNRTLTWGSAILGTMAPNQKLYISFDGRTTQNFAVGDLSKNDVTAIGTRTVEGVPQTFTTSDFAFVTYGNEDMDVTKTSDIATAAYPGDTVTYTVTVTNSGTTTLNNISVYDAMPSGVTYVAASAEVEGPVSANVRDEFSSAAYDNDDGTANWSGDWTETDSFGAGPGSGAVWVTGGALQFRPGTTAGGSANDPFTTDDTYNGGTGSWTGAWTEENDAGTPDYSTGTIRLSNGNNRLELRQCEPDDAILRTANVAGATLVTVSFDYTDAGVEAGETVIAEYSTGGGYTSLVTLDDGMTGSYSFPIVWNPVNNTITLRFRSNSGSTWSWDNDYVYLDNVDITFSATASASGSLINRSVDLTGATSATLSFDYSAANLESGDTIVAEINSDGGATFTPLQTFDGDNTAQPDLSYDISSYIGSATTVQFRVSGGIDADGEYCDIDNVNIAYSGGITTVAGHDPPGFVLSGDNYDLAAGQSLILTFQATIDDPLATGITEITNTASVTSSEIFTPVSASVTDPVVNPDQSSAVVGDRVWLDANGNGILDLGESGIPNVKVTLKDQYGTPLQTMLTNSIGYYQFSDVEIDTGYYVEITDGLPPGLVQTTDGRTDNRTDSFDLSIAASSGNYRDEFSSAAYDNDDGTANWNGDWVETDPSGAGAGTGTIWITGGDLQFRPGIVSGNANDPFTTDNTYNGGTGWNNGPWTEENDPGTPDYSTGTIQLQNNNNRLQLRRCDVDDAILRSQTVTGADSVTVSFDYDDAGIEAGETVIAEYSADGGASYTPLVVLDNNDDGSYSFPIAWDPADPTITLRFRSGSTWNNDNDRVRLDNVNIAYSGSNSAAGSLIKRVADIEHANSATLSFGYEAANLESGDTIVVEASPDGSNFTVLETFDGTAGSGSRSYDLVALGLASDTTTVRFRATSGLDAADEYFNIDDVDIAYTIPDLTLTEYLDADLGYQPDPGTAFFGDLVWSDADRDGIRDPGEPGLPGVTVRLYTDTNGNGIIDGGEPFIETDTDAAGRYLFAGVAASGTEDYIVWVDQSDLPAYDLTIPITGIYSYQDVDAGDSYLNADFGFVQNTPGTTYDISDRVWLDNGLPTGTGDNGIQDGTEGGLAGVTVDLLDASLNLIATTTTDSNGDFTFSGVPAGVRYTWEVTDQAGVLNSYYGTTPSALSGSFQMPGTLTVDLDYTSVPHFGYNLSRSLGDTVFNDNGAGGGTVGNGVQDGDEPGIRNVTVTLYRDVDNDGNFEPGGDDGASLGILVTDANGKYLFSGLSDGWYWVSIDDTQVALSDFYLTSTDNDGSAAGHQRRVQISGGVSNFEADFGYDTLNPGSLSGTLWEDDDVDGIIDGTEPRLANVTVDLIRNGVVIATATTDASGDYAFAGLATPAPGVDYTVRVTDINSVLNGYEIVYEKTEGTTEPFDGEEDESLTSDEDVDDIDFGFFKIKPTLAVISYFKAFVQNGHVILEWETVSQVGTLGFTVARRDEGSMMRVTNRPIPALVFPHGGVYRCLDATAKPGETYTYHLIELEASGQTRRYGPYTVTADMVDGAMDTRHEADLFRKGFSRTDRRLVSSTTETDGSLKSFEAVVRPSKMAVNTALTQSFDRGLERSVGPGPLTGVRDVKIRVEASGLYRVAVDKLALALNVNEVDVIDTLAAGKVRLSNRGLPVAYYPEADYSAIYFYGEAFSSIYTDHNVYWLKLMPDNGMGDLNNDGLIDAADLAIGLDVMTGRPAGDLRPDYAASDADVNGNGKVDMAELAYIRNALAGFTATSADNVPALTGEDKSFSATVHFEKETFFKTDVPIDVADFWFWDIFTLGNPQFGPAYGFDPFPLDVPAVAPGDTFTAELTVHFHGFSDNLHRADVILNQGTGSELNLGEVNWSGFEPVSKTFSFNQQYLVEGANTVKVVGLTTDDAFGVDSFDLTYQKSYVAAGDMLHFTAGGNDVITVTGFAGPDISLFDLSDTKTPRRVQNAALDTTNNRITVAPENTDTPYLALLPSAVKEPELLADEPSNLKDPSNRADYLIIAADELTAGAQLLSDYRSGRGMTPMVVRLSDVLDEFSFGVYDPYAIRDFIDFALTQWTMSPQYVLLVGDGTFDYKNNLETFSVSVRNLMPVVMTFTPYGIYASDVIYGDVDEDRLSNVVLGRIPVKTINEMSDYVSKIIAYEAGVPGARDNVLMVADKPDSTISNNFPADSNDVSALVNGFTVDTLYYPGRTAGEMRNDFVAAVDSGEWLVNYIGHGGYDVMSNFFNTTHQGLLTNGQFPIYVALTCLAGDFSYPWMDTLSEELVLRSGGGMIAAWSPTGLSINSEAVRMNKELFWVLFDEKAGTIGQAVSRALERYQALGNLEYPYMQDIYSLLGDPALQIR